MIQLQDDLASQLLGLARGHVRFQCGNCRALVSMRFESDPVDLPRCPCCGSLERFRFVPTPDFLAFSKRYEAAVISGEVPGPAGWAPTRYLQTFRLSSGK